MSETYFDHFYAGGADYYGLDARPEYHAFIARLGKDARLLDLACGQGRHAIPAARTGASVHAVDYSKVAIDQLGAYAAQEGLAIAAEHADIRRFAPTPAYYDAAVSVSTLSHFDEPDLTPLVAMTLAALKPGGRAFVEAFTTADPGFTGTDAVSETAGALKHYFTPGALRQLFEDGGFIVDAYHEFIEADLSHGPAHNHGVALLIGTRPA